MSTRSTTHFIGYGQKEPEAIVYRHSDGYPDGAGTDIYRFFEDVQKQTKDTRFTDPSYLAAKYVVWLAGKFAHRYEYVPGGESQWVDTEPLDFLSVGIVREDPGDIEYRYIIDTDKLEDGVPTVTCVALNWGEGETVEEIPRP